MSARKACRWHFTGECVYQHRIHVCRWYCTGEGTCQHEKRVDGIALERVHEKRVDGISLERGYMSAHMHLCIMALHRRGCVSVSM